MLIIAPLAFLVSLYLLLRVRFPDREWRDSLLLTSLGYGFLLGLGMQALSLFSLINRQAMVLFWALMAAGTLALLLILMRRRGGGLKPLDSIRTIRQLWGQLDLLSRTMLSIIVVYSLVLLLVALLAPPNTNDSLRYHLPRVLHWLNNGSLEHYATAIDRQLYMQTWAELAVMNLLALWGGDRLVNLVQWFAMLGTLAGVSVIARRFGAGARGQVFAAFFAATLPMGILQATSTQTDYVTAFWAVCLGYFVLEVHQHGLDFQRDWLTPLGLALAVALGVMTKGSFFAVAMPFLLWLLVTLIQRHAWRGMLALGALGLLLALVLNAPDLWRNQQTFGSPFGPATKRIGNSSFTPGVMVSNLIRNATLHTATPWGDANGIEMRLVAGALGLIGQDPNDPGTTLSDYRIKFSFHEDFAGNPLQFVLMLAGTGWLFWAATRRDAQARGALPWLLAVLVGWLLFSALFKWQPYGSRLQLPLFLLWAPPAGLLFERLKPGFLGWGLVTLMLLASLIFVISNPSRPLFATRISTRSLLAMPRLNALFNNDPGARRPYVSAALAIRERGCTAIGLKLESSDPEYPLWYILAPTGTERQIRYLNSDSVIAPDKQFKPCAVICTICGADQSSFGLPLFETFSSIKLFMR